MYNLAEVFGLFLTIPAMALGSIFVIVYAAQRLEIDARETFFNQIAQKTDIFNRALHWASQPKYTVAFFPKRKREDKVRDIQQNILLEKAGSYLLILLSIFDLCLLLVNNPELRNLIIALPVSISHLYILFSLLYTLKSIEKLMG